jgi:hypothetical protein
MFEAIPPIIHSTNHTDASFSGLAGRYVQRLAATPKGVLLYVRDAKHFP